MHQQSRFIQITCIIAHTFRNLLKLKNKKNKLSSSAGRFNAMPAETKNYQSLWQLPTLCCQKVYYDSRLQSLLGPAAALGKLTCANEKPGQL